MRNFGQEGDICALAGEVPRYEHDFDGGYRIAVCPNCGGPADNGHDREIPPNPYWCTSCTPTAEVFPRRNTQIGGRHYADLAIQPAEYAMANNLNYWQSNALKYLTRYKSKGGEQDIDKAIHCLQMLREYEYGHGPESP